MGAWGVNSFENDDALDWIADLVQVKDVAFLIATFNVVNKAVYREAPECSHAVAAAEVVAALHGKPASNLPEQIVNWVSIFDADLDNGVISLAYETLDHVVTDSELQLLWAEGGDFENWKSSVMGLMKRLS